jgi:ferredoxin
LWAGVKARVSRAARLRPPGALPPGAFERSCIRCFRCAEVCPVQCIRFDSSVSLVDMDTPFIDASVRGCTLCMKCTQACPTGALQDTPALDHVIQAKVRMGTPVLDKNACLTWNRTGVCRLCFYACPFAGSAVTVTGPGLGPLFHPDACVGCGLCEEACPRDAHAIRIMPPTGDPT